MRANCLMFLVHSKPTCVLVYCILCDEVVVEQHFSRQPPGMSTTVLLMIFHVQTTLWRVGITHSSAALDAIIQTYCNILRIMFAILTFATSIVDILTFRHFDFDIVTVDIFIVDILTVHPYWHVLAMALASVGLSVCHTAVLYQRGAS